MVLLKNLRSGHKKSLFTTVKRLLENWVNDGARTHDPRYHKPML